MKYLSPSSFLKGLNCEHHLYLEKVKRVLGEEQPRTYSLAMCTGTAFDIMVKGALNRRIKVAEELKQEIPPEYTAAIEVAKVLFECYNNGPMQELRKEGIGYGSIDQETEIQYYDAHSFPGVIHLWSSILYGKPDLTLTDGTVLDWKCQGMFGSGKQPVDGYVRCYLYDKSSPFNGKDLGPTAKSDVPLEEINRDWATQTYLYARLLGHKVGAKLRAGIENVCVDKRDVVRIASYRNPITPNFQSYTELKFHTIWAKMNGLVMPDGKPLAIDKPHYHKNKCVKYNKICNVAEFCDAYKLRNDPPAMGSKLNMFEGLI